MNDKYYTCSTIIIRETPVIHPVWNWTVHFGKAKGGFRKNWCQGQNLEPARKQVLPRTKFGARWGPVPGELGVLGGQEEISGVAAAGRRSQYPHFGFRINASKSQWCIMIPPEIISTWCLSSPRVSVIFCKLSCNMRYCITRCSAGRPER